MSVTASASTPGPPSAGARAASAFLVLLGAFFWLVMLLVLVGLVPRSVEVFEKFEVRLPTLTILVCTVCLFVARYWYLFGFAWFAATVALMCWLPSRKRGHMFAAVFAGVSFIVTAIVTGGIVLSLRIPLRHGLEVFGKR